jgi:hypothetical protein
MTKIRVKKDFWVLIGVDCYILSIFNPCRWAEGLLLLVIFPTLVEPFFVPLPEVVVYLIMKVIQQFLTVFTLVIGSNRRQMLKLWHDGYS